VSQQQSALQASLAVVVMKASTANHAIEPLNGEIFHTLRETQVLVESWRVHYHTTKPNSLLEYRLPAPETLTPIEELPNQRKAA